MALISNLPLELLHAIFSFVVEYEEDSFRKRHGYSQVCQYWRTVALGNPDLWRDIDHYEPEPWIPELLQRSQGANLRVYLGRAAPPEMVQAIARCHLGRIEDFCVDIDLGRTVDLPSVLHEGIQTLSTRELPLRIFDMGVYWHGPLGSSPPVVPALLNQDIAQVIRRSPRLEQLVLSGRVNFLWDIPLPSSLTNLRLSRVNRPSLSALLDLLRQTPQLQHLGLDWCGPQDESITSAPTSVNLPCLRTIDFEGIDLATESFFRYLNVPANKVHFQFRCRHAEPTPIPVIQDLSERFHLPDDRLKWPPIRHLSVYMEDYIAEFDIILSSHTMQATNFGEWKTVCSKLVKHSEEDDFVCLAFYWQPEGGGYCPLDFPPEHLDAFVRHFAQLPLHNLQVLDLTNSAFACFTPETITELMNNLPKLVYLEAFADTSLWEYLERKQKEKGVTSPHVDALPKLRYIVAHMGCDADEDTAEALGCMEKWLSARLASTGSKLVRLEFSFDDWDTFRGAKPDLDAFSQLVDVVIFGNRC